MSFGQSRTSKFLVGTFEVRLGAMENAGSLSSAHSIGVVDNFSLQLDMQKVELTESFPARIVDTALSSSLSSFSANLKEYSARNIRTMLSAGIEPYTVNAMRYAAKESTPVEIKKAATTIPITVTTSRSSKLASASIKLTSRANFNFAKIEDFVASSTSKKKVTFYSTPFGSGNYIKVDGSSSYSSRRLPTSSYTARSSDAYWGYKEQDQNSKDGDDYTDVPSSTELPEFVGHRPWNYATPDTDFMNLEFRTTPGSYYVVEIPVYTLNGSLTFTIKDNQFIDGTSSLKVKNRKLHAPVVLKFVATEENTLIEIGVPYNRGDDVFVLQVNKIKVTKDAEVNFAAGDLVTIFVDGDPTNVTVAEVDSAGTNAITIKAPGLNQAIPANSTYTVYKNEVVRAGEPDPTKQFFSATLVQLDRNTGAPLVFDFWKCSMTSGLNVALNNANFSSMDMQVKVLKPTARDYASGGPLAHLSQIIPRFPTWRYSAMPD